MMFSIRKHDANIINDYKFDRYQLTATLMRLKLTLKLLPYFVTTFGCYGRVANSVARKVCCCKMLTRYIL